MLRITPVGLKRSAAEFAATVYEVCYLARILLEARELVSDEGPAGLAGYGRLIPEYIPILRAKLQFHQCYPEFNGQVAFAQYLSRESANDPNEAYATSHSPCRTAC
jgi:hypothetical protein